MRRRAPTVFPGFQAGPSTLRQRLFGHARTRTQAWLWAGVAACVLAALALHAQTQARQSAQRALAAAQQAAVAPPPAHTALSAAQEARWRLALKQLNADWRAWFEALERHTPDEVALRAIEPDAARGQLQVQGEARDIDPLLAWARALGGDSRFASVRPLQHQSQDTEAGPRVLLTLEITLADTAPAAEASAPGRTAP